MALGLLPYLAQLDVRYGLKGQPVFAGEGASSFTGFKSGADFTRRFGCDFGGGCSALRGLQFFKRRASVFAKKVLPASPVNEIVHAPDRDAVALGEVLPGYASNVVAPEANNVSGLKACDTAPLPSHVLRVLPQRSGFKVGGVNASGVVAAVHDDDARRDRPVSVLIGEAVRKSVPHIGVYGKHSVPLVVSVGLPFQAAVPGGLNLRPKAIIQHVLILTGYPSEVKQEVCYW